MTEKIRKGKVFIAGAGPGDPGLITLKTLKKLKLADVVVYDRLINNEFLSFCKKDCEKIFVGKESGHHLIEQDKITEILIEKAKSGLTVVRLKGGDPFVYGRGSEEAIELKKAGIEFEIIPGITSGLSAPIYSGIPTTQRNIITQCIFVTAHECPDKPGSQVDWESLAKLKNTSLIIYMGASRIEAISEKLIQYGMDSSTSVAAIENATLPNQRTLTARLDNIAADFKREKFHAPVIIIVSPTVALREKISWYEKKPLLNKRIAVAGAQEHFDRISNMLYELGAKMIPLEVLKTQLNDPGTIKQLFIKDDFEWVLFSSQIGVKYFWELLQRENLDARIFGNKKIAAIGSGVAKNIKSFGLNPDYSAEEFKSEFFQKDFLSKYKKDSKKLLRITGDSTDDKISGELKNSSIKIQSLKVYSVLPNQPEDSIITAIQNNYPDIFVFNSKLSIDYFFKILGHETAEKLLNNCKSIVVDPVSPDALTAMNPHKEKLTADHTINYIQEIFSKLIYL